MINIDKISTTTSGGYPVKVEYVSPNNGKYPIKGYAIINDEQKRMEWTSDGLFDERVPHHMFNLIEGANKCKYY